MILLINYITEIPGPETTDKRKFKFPMVASKLISSEFMNVLDFINDNEKSLVKLVEFLNNDPPLNTTLTGYFVSACDFLLSRDNALLKILHRDSFSNFYRHLSNRSLSEFIAQVLRKSLRSKKLINNSLSFFEGLLQQLRFSENTESSQKIFAQLINEDEFYEVASKNLGVIFELLKAEDENIIKSGLRVLKSLLEKEKDLKRIDEEFWGSDNLVSKINENKESLLNIIKNSKSSEIMTSFKENLKLAGEPRLLCLEIFILLLEMNHSIINDVIRELNAFHAINEMIEAFPLNSFLHNLHYCFIATSFITDFKYAIADDLCNFIIKHCLSPHDGDYKKLGLISHIWNLARLIVETTQKDGIFHERVQRTANWEELLAKFEHRSKIETVESGCHLQNALSLQKFAHK